MEFISHIHLLSPALIQPIEETEDFQNDGKLRGYSLVQFNAFELSQEKSEVTEPCGHSESRNKGWWEQAG